jgi:hypothetical protein
MNQHTREFTVSKAVTSMSVFGQKRGPMVLSATRSNQRIQDATKQLIGEHLPPTAFKFTVYVTSQPVRYSLVDTVLGNLE